MKALKNPCELCEQHSVRTPARHSRWWHKAFGNTECRSVALCRHCVDYSDEYDRNAEPAEYPCRCGK